MAENGRILLHACCGPCATHCIEAVRRIGYEPTLHFANDNLSSDSEYERRLDALATVASHAAVPLMVSEYDHAAWLADVRGLESESEGGTRCSACFRHSLQRTAAQAAAEGFGVFTTTLSVSPHKRSAQLFDAGRAAAIAAGEVSQFLACDFKKDGGFARSVALARELGLYRQDYCGCEFSRKA